MAGKTITVYKIGRNLPFDVRSAMVQLSWWCPTANSTSATFRVQLTVQPENATFDDVSVTFTLRDVTSNSSRSVTVTATDSNIDSSGNVNVTNTGTFTCAQKTDTFQLTQSAGSGIQFIGSTLTQNGQIYWTSGSGGGGGGSGSGSYTLYLGQANLIFPNTSNPPYPNVNNANDGSSTFGYLAGSNGTNSNSSGIWNPITFSNQNGTNTFYINGNTVKYNNVTYTATSRDTSKYRFVGWNQNANANIQLSALAVGNNVYVQAYFEEIPSYTITYNANGGSGAPGVTTVKEGATATLSSTKPTRNGYYFAGWSTSSSAISPAYTSGTTIQTDENITLYAVWWKCAYIYNGSTWKQAIPYICTGSTNWRRSMPYVYSGGWK